MGMQEHSKNAQVCIPTWAYMLVPLFTNGHMCTHTDAHMYKAHAYVCAQIHTDVHAGLSRYSPMKGCSMHVCTHTPVYAPVAQPRSQQGKVGTLKQGENNF